MSTEMQRTYIEDGDDSRDVLSTQMNAASLDIYCYDTEPSFFAINWFGHGATGHQLSAVRLLNQASPLQAGILLRRQRDLLITDSAHAEWYGDDFTRVDDVSETLERELQRPADFMRLETAERTFVWNRRVGLDWPNCGILGDADTRLLSPLTREIAELTLKPSSIDPFLGAIATFNKVIICELEANQENHLNTARSVL